MNPSNAFSYIVRTMLSVLFAASLTSNIHAQFINGNTLVEWMRAYQSGAEDKKLAGAESVDAGAFLGYVTAAVDLFGQKLEVSSEITPGQCCAVVAKFLKAHPERWDESAIVLVHEALFEGFGRKQEE